MNYFLCLLALFLSSQHSFGQEAREIRRFSVPEAKQAVAVDKHHFYVINNSTITKHDKHSGHLVGTWDGSDMGIKHLNSGVVIKNRLYCANSNYPETPMAGSIEIFDTQSLQHIGNQSFGISIGSPTWIDRKRGNWYVGFAHYTGKGGSEGKDTRWTTVSSFNRRWQLLESWVFPKNMIEAFKPMSNSGAAWGWDGRLYCTGHDEQEIYVLEIPNSGYTLKYLETIKITSHGQGIAFDRSVKDRMLLYGIIRRENAVVVSEIDPVWRTH
jgi:hypothetical protein